MKNRNGDSNSLQYVICTRNSLNKRLQICAKLMRKIALNKKSDLKNPIQRNHSLENFFLDNIFANEHFSFLFWIHCEDISI